MFFSCWYSIKSSNMLLSFVICFVAAESINHSSYRFVVLEISATPSSSAMFELSLLPVFGLLSGLLLSGQFFTFEACDSFEISVIIVARRSIFLPKTRTATTTGSTTSLISSSVEAFSYDIKRVVGFLFLTLFSPLQKFFN